MENRKIWFRAKKIGWGWTPITWEGWIVTILYIIPIVQFSILANQESHSSGDFVIDLSIPFVINTIFLLIICYAHGEKPGWNWGKK